VLIELSRNPAIQTRLREVLLQSASDPAWKEPNNHNSFLNAFTCEILCIHPALPEIQRMVSRNDWK
jgi:hypothetical protein